MITSVIFDFDGTLVDSNEIKYKTFFDVTSHLEGAREILLSVLSDPDFGDRTAVFNHLACTLNSSDPKSYVDADLLNNSYTVLCEKKIMQAPEIKGAKQSLETLHSMGMNLIVSSATPEETLNGIVIGRNISSLFSEILGSPDSKEDHIDYIINKFKIIPNDVIYVGDSEVDRRSALNKGCFFIGIGSSSDRFKIKPTYMIEDMSDLLEIIINISK